MGRNSSPVTVRDVPIAALPLGEIAPPSDPDHATWVALDGWDDPFASRGGYNIRSRKTAVTRDGGAAIEFGHDAFGGRGLLTGESAWRDYTVECRLEMPAGDLPPSPDEPFGARARAGIVFRWITARAFYCFCVEPGRLVLYRRRDEDWFELAAQDITPASGAVTLRVHAEGASLRADCPERGVHFEVSDGGLPEGKAGFRAAGPCYLYSLRLCMTPAQQTANAARQEERLAQVAHLGAALPDEEEVASLPIPPDAALLECVDFAQTGRCDLLWRLPQALLATTLDGRELWRLPESPSALCVAAAAVNGSRIYALAGVRREAAGRSVKGGAFSWVIADEALVLDGATGRVLKRAALPAVPDAASLVSFAVEAGLPTERPGPDFVLRDWRDSFQGGGCTLWAYDVDLNLLWQREVHPPFGHGNAVHLVDLNGDRRIHVLAGGVLYSPEGDILWAHDRAEELVRTPQAGHYDAALLDDFNGDGDPTAFLAGGSAGLYVADGRTGRTRVVHRMGHAQWVLPCKLRDDLAGRQVMAGTRWGNPGILSLFSGGGERLWTTQPDCILQGACPVQWTSDGPEHIWMNTSRHAFGLYDGHGRLVKRLDRMRTLWDGEGRRGLVFRPLRRTPDGLSLLACITGDRLRLFAPRR